LTIMKDIASLLTKETQKFKQTLNDKMKQGLSYPLARMEALLSCDLLCGYSKESLSDILSSPNNILGIEYLKALLLLNSSITPVTIQRRGACYHDPDLGDFHFLDDKLVRHEGLSQNIQISSATSIRNQIHSTNNRTFNNNDPYDQVFKRQEGSISDKADILLRSIENSVPVSVYKELCDSFLESFPIYEDDYSEILTYILLTMDRHQLSSYYDMNLDIASRLDGYRLNYHKLSSLADELKTKQYTSTRIKRALLHIILQITNQDYELYSKHGEHLYARLLGFKKESSFLLKQARLHSQIPIITKVGDARNILSKEAYYLFEKDIFASHLYNQIVYSKFGTKLDNEYTHGVVIV
ncbi:MAG TPA: nucleotidyltransferase family protein, partial [Lachnospiraceae bacterium]|nr:nucleotidyltransferase family protein [Lachnospiraceae bacterium]